MFIPSISLLVRMLLENKSDIRYTLHVYTTYFIICICQPYSSVLEVHVKRFLNELLVSLIMPLLSSKSVDEKINQFFLIGCLLEI